MGAKRLKPMPKKKKSSRRLPHTPNSIIQNALRQVWLRSRERRAAIVRENNTCECCGAKGSKTKGREVDIEVHHRHGHILWAEILTVVRRYLLVHPDALEVLCKRCHDGRHDDDSWLL